MHVQYTDVLSTVCDEYCKLALVKLVKSSKKLSVYSATNTALLKTWIFSNRVVYIHIFIQQ